MCGIAGVVNAGPQSGAIIRAMTARLYHRGPDAGDVWIHPEQQLALGHRRLSILDLSSAGSQPMCSASGRYIICYNGEIYNFHALRQELVKLGYPFRSHSDTEVLLAGIEHWGLRKTLAKITGMFAFGLWDQKEKRLSLVRDRAGKKPLYYGWAGGCFVFASELKAIRSHPGFETDLDRNALGEYLRFGWVPEPLSIYASARKLPAGSLLELVVDMPHEKPEPEYYWHSTSICQQAALSPFTGQYEDAIDELENHLTQAVASRMVADVNLGALLSGGVDSSTVVALMQKLSSQPVKTFCIGFHEAKYNEAEYASAVAKHLGTEHHELYVSARHCLDIVSRLPEVYDEPFADSSQLPTLLLAQMAREHVTVVLSGDGGDELFGGYKRYIEAVRLWRGMHSIPQPLRELSRQFLMSVEQSAWYLVRGKGSAEQRVAKWFRALAKLEKRSRGWSAATPEQLLIERFERVPDPGRLVPGYVAGHTDMLSVSNWLGRQSPLLQLRLLDFVGYLCGDILTKVDRATMAVGLEARSPLLDTRVTEFAWSLPDNFLLDSLGGKRILRDVMHRHIPRELTDRPKRGFGVPVDLWLRKDLKQWAEELLDPAQLKQQGILNSQAVQEVWKQHQRGWRNHANLLWALLMFQTWLRRLQDKND